MCIHSHRDFLNEILQNLGFCPAKASHCTRFSSENRPEDGFLLLYERPGLYSLAVADYTVPSPFSLTLESQETLLHFGSLYDGNSWFDFQETTGQTLSPASFLIHRENVKSRQFWNAGQRCRGLVFTLYPAFLKQSERIWPQVSLLDRLSKNRAYHALPFAVVILLHQLFQTAQTDRLTPLVLEGSLLQCLGNITESLEEGTFCASQIRPVVYLGKKKITFDEIDLLAIQQAKQILTENLANAPTIAQLGKQVFLNEQKLKAGFSMCFHMTIGRYLKECRMAKAAALLTATTLSVREVGQAVGYASCASFIKTFREHYKKTPQEFRITDTEKPS